MKGYLALVLHSHLPFVRHPEHDRFLEEDWLFEAITETYLPLLRVFDGLVRDGLDFRITLSLSPTLIAMLTDPLLQQRYVRHLNRLVELAEREVLRTASEPEFHALAVMYRDLFRDARQAFQERYGRNLVAAFRRFQDLGRAELITSAATHAFLPLLRDRKALRAQVLVAAEQHARLLGAAPRGIWLPECGYAEGIDEVLAEAGIRYFFTDAHGILHATPRPQYGVYAPLTCPSGVAAFGRDLETSAQVWSSREGYPGDPWYRDFYRDAGFDLDPDYLRPYLPPGGGRAPLGIKYHRITGGSGGKAPYVRSRALERAAVHAGDFLAKREEQADRLAGAMPHRRPLIIAPYDAELFGHWWFEGPDWLDQLFRAAARGPRAVGFITPSEYLDRHPRRQKALPAASSWGYRGYAEFWLNEKNDWTYRHLDRAAERMMELAQRHPSARGTLRRALDQAARELLLAQASDWAFIMRAGGHADYAERRIQDHLLRFTRLYDDITAGRVDEAWLGELEYRDNCFPEIDYRVYA